MVLLFLAGVSKLEHVQIKDAFEIKGEINLSTYNSEYRSNCQKFVFATHIAYEAHNATVCRNLAQSLKGSELIFRQGYSGYDLTLFDYTVIGYFISNSCHSWKSLRFEGQLTDRAVVLLGRFQSPSNSNVAVEQVEFNCSDCSVISVVSFIEKVGWFTATTRISISAKLPSISQEGSAFGCLVSSNLKCLENLTVSIGGTFTEYLQWKLWGEALQRFSINLASNKTLKQMTLKNCFEGTSMKSAMETNNVLTELRLEGTLNAKEACNFFQGLCSNRSLKSLHITTSKQPMIIHSFGDCCSVEESFTEFKKLLQQHTCTIEHLDLSWCGLTDENIENIASGLVENKSVVTLNLSGNNITAKGCKKLFEALSCNKNVKQLILADMGTLTKGDTTDAGKAMEQYLAMDHTLTFLSFRNCKMDNALIYCLTRALARNASVTELDISRQCTFSESENMATSTCCQEDASLNCDLLLAAQRHPTLQRVKFRNAIFNTCPQQLYSSAVLVEVSGCLIGEALLEYIRRRCLGSEIWMKVMSSYGNAHIHLISELKETSYPTEMTIVPETAFFTDEEYLSTISKALPRLVRIDKHYTALLSVNASSWDTFRMQKEIPCLRTGTWAKCSKISTRDCELVFESLSKNTNLMELEIAKTEFGKKGAKSLASLLNAKEGSFQISLIDCNFHDHGVKAIAAALQENTTLVLCESTNMKQFLQSLQQNSSFRKLHISSSQIVASDFQKFFKKCKYLSHLHITDSHLEVDGDTLMCAILQSTSLTEVTLENLTFHPISIFPRRHKCVFTETQLNQLRIANCELKLRLKAWSVLLSCTSSLACFELESCTLTDYEALTIAEGLSKNETLSTLQLRECALSNKGYTEILKTAKSMPTLKVLVVTGGEMKMWPSSPNEFCQCSQLVQLEVENFYFSGEGSTRLLSSLTQGKPLQELEMCGCKFHVKDIKLLIEVSQRINTVNVQKCVIERTAIHQFAEILQENFATVPEVWFNTKKSLHIFVQLKTTTTIHAQVATKDDIIQSATQMEWSMVQSNAANEISSIQISGVGIESMVNDFMQSDGNFNVMLWCPVVSCIRLKGLGKLIHKCSLDFAKSISIDALPAYFNLITALNVLPECTCLEDFTVYWEDEKGGLKEMLLYLQEHLSEAEFWIGNGSSASVVIKLRQECTLKTLNIKGPVKSLQPVGSEMQSQFPPEIYDESGKFEIDIHGAKEIERIADKTMIQKKCDIWVRLRGLSVLPSSICKSLIDVPLKMFEIKDIILTLKGTQSLTNVFELATEVNVWRCNLVDADVPVFVSAVHSSSQTRFQISDTTFATSEHLLQLLQEKHVNLRRIKMHPEGVPGMDYVSFLLHTTSKATRKPILSLKPIVKMHKNCVVIRAEVAVSNHSEIDINLCDVDLNAFCNIAEVLLANSAHAPILKEVHLIDCSLNGAQCVDLAIVLSKLSSNTFLALQNCRFEDLKTDTREFVPELETNSSVTMLHLCGTDIDRSAASLLWWSFRGLKLLKVEKVRSKDTNKLIEILCSQNHHLSKVCITACPSLSSDMSALSTALCNKRLRFIMLNGLSTIPQFVESCLSKGLRSQVLCSLKITFFVHEYRTNISSQLVDMLRYLYINLGTLKELSLCWKVEKFKKQVGYFYWSQPLQMCFLKNFTLGNEGLLALTNVLSKTSELKIAYVPSKISELTITNCYLAVCPPESSGLESLSKCIHKYTDLHRVQMGICPKVLGHNLDFTDILISVLGNPSIEKLKIDNCLDLELPPDRAKIMRDLLSANKSLTALTIPTFSQGSITFYKGLTHNHHLRHLNLIEPSSYSCSHNPEIADALSKFLSENSTITELTIACDFTEREYQKVAKGLKLNQVLKSLTIGYSPFSYVNECIFKSIWHNPKCARNNCAYDVM